MAESFSDERSVSRILNFSDAVYAIAITLLVLTIQIPENINLETSTDVVNELVSLSPQIFSYIFSFYIIGRYWIIHHRMFRSIAKFDDTTLYLNLLSLFFISFIPIPTAVLSKAGDTASGAAFYAIWIVLCSASFRLIWAYAVKRKYLVASMTKKEIKGAHLRGMIPIIIFAVSVPIAFISPYIAEAIWLAQVFLSPRLVEKFLEKYSGGE